MKTRSKSLEMRVASSPTLVRPGQAQGSPHLLALIYGWFTESFDTPDLKAAKALLDELCD